MENVVFTYQRTKEDVLKQQIWHTYRRNRITSILSFFFPILGIFLLVQNILTMNDGLIYVASIYLIFSPVINYFILKMRINNLFKNPSVAFDTTTFDYSIAGVNISSDKGDILLEWDRIFKVYDTKEYIFVYVDRRSSILVKKEILSESQIEFILKLLKENTIMGTCNF